jgi:hypothetical protein
MNQDEFAAEVQRRLSTATATETVTVLCVLGLLPRHEETRFQTEETENRVRSRPPYSREQQLSHIEAD